MNREIKFRGKKLNDGGWVYGHYFTEVEDDEGRFIPIHVIKTVYGDHYQDYKVDPETVGEYTGLKDKNGKEIYEGDIVIVNIPTPHDTYPADHDQNIGIVEWDSEGADYNIMKNSECLLGLGFTGATYEILGNIYENPELLK